MRYKIVVKTLQGNILTFTNVDSYEIEPGDILKFKDQKTKEIKRFHSSKCEIQRMRDDDD